MQKSPTLTFHTSVFASDRLNRYTSNQLNVRTFDDVLLVPQYSDISSRSKIDVSTRITKERALDIPIIAANMDSVCDSTMALAMDTLGGLGVIHRYMYFAQQLEEVTIMAIRGSDKNIAVAVGIKNGVQQHVIDLVSYGAKIIVIDVAHGHHQHVADVLKQIKSLDLYALDNKPVEVIAGNVATEAGARFLIENGADGIKVGVGPGSICTTRQVTGHGFPQLAAISQIAATARHAKVPVIADGGIRNSGDIVKALAAGASAVMLGSLLAGTEEAPGEAFTDAGGRFKLYRGMASREAQKDFFGNYPKAPEGITVRVPYKGPVKPIVENLVAGIRSGLSYSGAANLAQLQEKADWIPVSASGIAESFNKE